MGLSVWQILIALLLFAIPIAALILSIVSLSKIGEVKRRIAHIEGKLED